MDQLIRDIDNSDQNNRIYTRSMQCLTDLTIFQYSDPLVLDHFSRSLLGVYTRRTWLCITREVLWS